MGHHLQTGNFYKLNELLDSGYTPAEVFSHLRDYNRDEATIFERFIRNYPRSLRGLIPGMEQLMAFLRANGHPTTETTFCTDAAQMLLVDDREENVNAAIPAGMDAIVFTTAAQLAAQLHERGILTHAQSQHLAAMEANGRLAP